ncbi:hypothetical protein [Myroides marinus]|nr:hypothetical protein [Myroides marinus]
MIEENKKHWSKVEYLHETVKNQTYILREQQVTTAMHGLVALKIV